MSEMLFTVVPFDPDVVDPYGAVDWDSHPDKRNLAYDELAAILASGEQVVFLGVNGERHDEPYLLKKVGNLDFIKQAHESARLDSERRHKANENLHHKRRS